MRRFLTEHRVTIWLVALTGVIAATAARLHIAIDDLEAEVRRSAAEDCMIRDDTRSELRGAFAELVVLIRESATDPETAAAALVDRLETRLLERFPEVEC